MSNKKQSSVDFLINLLTEKGYAGVLSEDEVEQAKAMHEEEIIIAHGSGSFDRHNDFSRTPEQYYNETFNNDAKK